MNWLYVAGGVATVFVAIFILALSGALALSPDQCFDKYIAQVQEKEYGSTMHAYSDYYSDWNCNAIKITDYYESNYSKYGDLDWHLKEGVSNAPQPDENRMQQIQQVGMQRGIEGLKTVLKLFS